MLASASIQRSRHVREQLHDHLIVDDGLATIAWHGRTGPWLEGSPDDGHLIDTPGSKAFVAAFTKKYNKPPENQAWGDYIALKILAQSMNDVKSTEAAKLVEHWEKGAKFDLLKTRPGYFRAWDHQLMHEMYAVEALKASELKNQWDIYKPSPPVPGANEDLEIIAPTKEENACTFV